MNQKQEELQDRVLKLAIGLEECMSQADQSDKENLSLWLGLFRALPRIRPFEWGLINDEEECFEFFMGPHDLQFSGNEEEIRKNTVMILVYMDKMVWCENKPGPTYNSGDLSYQETLHRILEILRSLIKFNVPDFSEVQLEALRLLEASTN